MKENLALSCMANLLAGDERKKGKENVLAIMFFFGGGGGKHFVIFTFWDGCI